MIALRPSASRGTSQSNGVLCRHSFSYGNYHDPAHMGLGVLRVLNEFELAPSASLASEPRANIELLNFVVSGGLLSPSGSGTLRAGELCGLSAGSGSEDGGLANASDEASARVLQIWLQPDRVNARPLRFHASITPGAGSSLLASGSGREGSAVIRQDVDIHALDLRAGHRLTHALCFGRRAWLQLTRGSLAVNGVNASAGDGVIALNECAIELLAQCDAGLLLFDLPG